MSLIEDFKHMKWLPLAGGALLCVLGLTALAVPLIGIALTALQRKRVSVRLEKPEDVQSGQTVNIVWRAENNSPLPVLQLRLRVLLENELTGEQTRRTIRLQAGAHASAETQAAFSSRYCGSVRVCTERAESRSGSWCFRRSSSRNFGFRSA